MRRPLPDVLRACQSGQFAGIESKYRNRLLIDGNTPQVLLALYQISSFRKNYLNTISRYQDLPEEVAWSSWIGFLYVALFSQFLGFFAWYKGLAMGGVARVSQTQLLMPFFVLFFSWLLLGEAIGWETFLFAGFVVGTVAIGKRMAIRRQPSED